MSAASEQLIERAAQARKENRPADAKQDLTEAIALLRQDEPGPELAQALRLLGKVERKLHDHAAARQHYEEAVSIYRTCGDAPTLAHTIRHLGDVHHDAGRRELAEPCYSEALNLYRGNPEASALDVANAVRSMAVLKAETGEGDQALLLWEEARDLYSGLNVTAGVTECDKRLARLKA